MNTPVTFLHTADWQLGMVRRFLGPDGQARFSQARVDAISRIGELAAETGAAFVVVAGDVFEHNQVDRRTVLRACEALKQIACPVLLLPGNHDALEPGSLWASPQWKAHAPAHVMLLDDTTPREIVPGVEVVGAPWRSKRPLGDPASKAYDALPPAAGFRVLVAHGQAGELHAGAAHLPAIELAGLTKALDDGRLHYVALGDRHSCTRLHDRVWYSGTQEVTSLDETDPGRVLKVSLDDGRCEVEPVLIGEWRMVEHSCELDDERSLHELEDWFAELPAKERTFVRLAAHGTLSLPLLTRLEAMVDAQGEVFAQVQRSPKQWSVRPLPDDADFDALQLSGPARAALDELREALAGGDDEAGAALALMHRLARSAG